MRINIRMDIEFMIYICEGEASTDNPRPYNPESNTPVIQF
jgi:hypothetical protein